MQNEEIRHLQVPTSWGGLECIYAFCKIFCVRIKLVLPGDVMTVGEEAKFSACTSTAETISAG